MDYSFRKEMGLTNCRIQQVWKAKRMLFWKHKLHWFQGKLEPITEEDIEFLNKARTN